MRAAWWIAVTAALGTAAYGLRQRPVEAAPVSTGCGAQIPGSALGDLYRALTRGSETEQAQASLAILESRAQQSRGVVRRAIAVIAANPRCQHLHPLTDTLRDATMGDATRAAAALALGAIARDHPCTFPGNACPPPHDPIPQWSKKALADCARNAPIAVQRACVEALGWVGSTEPAFLLALRDDPARDTLVRVFAGRALSRITGVPSVTQGSLDQLVDDARAAASD